MRYVCPICGYVYDEAQGPPWDTLPQDWKCPLCGAPKAVFGAEGGGESQSASVEPSAPSDLKPLTAIELSALCSNLAKGCEKQYLPEQAAAFTRLATWFRGQASPIEDASFAAILEKVDHDLSQGYSAVNAVAEEKGDRGARRSLVWSEKVTMILKSLLGRFAQEGEAMLSHTGVYVCTICGFVFVGEAPPELCPVCRVPAHKFERIGG